MRHRLTGNFLLLLGLLSLRAPLAAGRSCLQLLSLAIVPGGVAEIATAIRSSAGRSKLASYGGGVSAMVAPWCSMSVRPWSLPMAAGGHIGGKLTVWAVACVIMALNLVGMCHAHWFMAKVAMAPLLMLGAACGVLQAAPGAEMMENGEQEWVAPYLHKAGP